MPKKQTPNEAIGAASPQGTTRQRGKTSWFDRFRPYLDEIKTYADAAFKQARFDPDATDEQVEARNALRKVLADFPAKKGGETA